MLLKWLRKGDKPKTKLCVVIKKKPREEKRRNNSSSFHIHHIKKAVNQTRANRRFRCNIVVVAHFETKVSKLEKNNNFCVSWRKKMCAVFRFKRSSKRVSWKKDQKKKREKMCSRKIPWKNICIVEKCTHFL